MQKDYPANYQHLNDLLMRLSSELRGPMSTIHSLERAAMAEGALPCKTKQLMALSIAITQHAEGCLTFYIHDAIQAGATRAEILETIAVAVVMGGAPAAVYGSLALEAIDQFEKFGLTDQGQRSYGP